MRMFIAVFAAFGIGIAVLEVWLVRDVLSFRSAALRTEGEVIGFSTSRGSKGGTMYTPRVRFALPAAEGGTEREIEISGSVSSSSRGYRLGEKVSVLYQPDFPEDARINSFMEQWFPVAIVSFFTLVFNAIWIGFVVAAVRTRRMYGWLDQFGMTVQAKLTEVGKNTSLKVNGRSPWVIRAQWLHPVRNTVHLLTSENLWFDPSPYLAGVEEVSVRIDADNPRRHRIDLSFLPKQG